MKAHLRSLSKRYIVLFALAILVGSTGLAALILDEIDIQVPINGVACNYSSLDIWVTVTESGIQKAYALAPGNCTNSSTQDAEGIWGRDCDTGSCHYQSWKIAAGHFEVYDNRDPSLGSLLRIKGWGVGSRWEFNEGWPRPDLSTLDYALVR